MKRISFERYPTFRIVRRFSVDLSRYVVTTPKDQRVYRVYLSHGIVPFSPCNFVLAISIHLRWNRPPMYLFLAAPTPVPFLRVVRACMYVSPMKLDALLSRSNDARLILVQSLAKCYWNKSSYEKLYINFHMIWIILKLLFKIIFQEIIYFLNNISYENVKIWDI